MDGTDKGLLFRIAVRALLDQEPKNPADAGRQIAKMLVEECPGNYSEAIAFRNHLINDLTRQWKLHLAWIPERLP